jgi:excisionase family DNA binding protein
MSIKDAAKVLGLGRSTIYRFMGEGRLQTVKIGNRTLIKTASIRGVVEGGKADICECSDEETRGSSRSPHRERMMTRSPTTETTKMNPFWSQNGAGRE